MNLDSLNKWLTLTANLGVIAGIIFLAIELRQNNDLMAGQDRFNRLSAAQSNAVAVATTPELNSALSKPVSDLTNEDMNMLAYYYNSVFLDWDWSFKEVPRDDLPNCLWERTFNNESLQRFWPGLRVAYSSEFVSYLENELGVGCE